MIFKKNHGFFTENVRVLGVVDLFGVGKGNCDRDLLHHAGVYPSFGMGMTDAHLLAVVKTADEQILPNGTGYITDVGMTGPVQSVLGVKPEIIINKFKTNLPVRFENAEGEYSMDGCIIEIDEKTGEAKSIERVSVRG